MIRLFQDLEKPKNFDSESKPMRIIYAEKTHKLFVQSIYSIYIFFSIIFVSSLLTFSIRLSWMDGRRQLKYKQRSAARISVRTDIIEFHVR